MRGKNRGILEYVIASVRKGGRRVEVKVSGFVLEVAAETHAFTTVPPSKIALRVFVLEAYMAIESGFSEFNMNHHDGNLMQKSAFGVRGPDCRAHSLRIDSMDHSQSDPHMTASEST